MKKKDEQRRGSVSKGNGICPLCIHRIVGATRFERATPCSQNRCATSCATPRTRFISEGERKTRFISNRFSVLPEADIHLLHPNRDDIPQRSHHDSRPHKYAGITRHYSLR